MPSCLVCDGRDFGSFAAGLRRCEKCGYVFADLALTDAEFSALYERSYFFGEEYLDYLAERAVLQRNFSKRLEVLQRFLDPSRHRRLLEVGCAYGFFLDLVRERFERVVGIDVAGEGVRHAREHLGLDARHGDLVEQKFGDERFDVVCLWDTIEHLRNPRRYLEKIGSLVGKGGLLAVTTGDIGSLNARLKREHWRLIHPPTHAHYFSRVTLRRLLARCGFDVVYERHCGNYRSLGNIAYNILTLRWKKPGLYRFVTRLGVEQLAVYLNLYDILYVVARKRE